MKVFLELTKRAFQRHLTYRAATLAGLVTNFVFGLIRAAIFIALYGEREAVEGITIAGALTYTALSQAVIGYLSMFSWFELMNAVYSGEVTADLLKPISLFKLWLAQDFGRAMLNLLTRGLVMMLIFELVFDMIYPETPVQWLGLTASILLSWLISFAWRFLVNLSAFWTPNAIGILRFAFTLSWFFSGFLMPLRLFPEWVIQLSYLTPFPHTINTVVEVHLGLLQGPDLVQALLAQVGWAIVLIILSQLALRAGVKRLVILGG